MQEHEDFSAQVKRGERFEFGKNWARFLETVDEVRIGEAINAVRTLLRVDDLAGKTLLDIGSGSGLFSLAAFRLGARVVSFDFDPSSVACTRALKDREKATDERWRVLRGSVLDKDFLRALGQFDVVYSWGVLHHTGAMWEAMENAQHRVADGGRLCIAIYNYQEKWSKVWLLVKKLYNWLPRGFRWIVAIPTLVLRWAPTMIRDLLRGKPMSTWKTYARNRGMSPWHDLVDWVGGLPFEVAAPDEVFRFFDARGFGLVYLTTRSGGIGCNEYTFTKNRV